ncbi:MAG: DNA-directed RNA polymerase subunit alpha C-terminal domain-containing protein, partial [Chloroflexota bacterium]
MTSSNVADCVEMPIETLGFLVRAYNHLRRDGIHTVDKLIERLRTGRASLKYTRNLGELGLVHVLATLEAHGCLPDDLPLDVDIRTQEKRMAWVLATQ